jgi:NAD(P)-dependent dehydrogenase (short-subunit alcohol dehydrogenase family)
MRQVRDLAGRVAVVTGAASGIGQAIAVRLAGEGMKVVLADVEAGPLAEVAAGLSDALAVVTDVSRPDDLARLAEATLARFGAVHLLCNAAGVAHHGGEAIWEATGEDWRWLLDVNLLGAVHALRVFVPLMVAQGGPAHVVNIGSPAGLKAGGGVYGATKHALASLTESLHLDLRARGAPIGVTLVCPGLTATRIADAARNRPVALANPRPDDDAQRASLARVAAAQAAGMAPERAAEAVVAAVRDGTFYALVGVDAQPMRARAEAIAGGGDPPARRRRVRAPATVAVVCGPERGHLQRLLPVIAALAARGVTVHVLGDARHAAPVAAASMG